MKYSGVWDVLIPNKRGKAMEFNLKNHELGVAVEKLPKSEENISLYLNILATTDQTIVRNEMAYLLSQMCPKNEELKKTLLDLIKSPKTKNAKGSLMYALSFVDYSDEECVEMLCEQLHKGNFECMYKAFEMLENLIAQGKVDEKVKGMLHNICDDLDERLGLAEELFDKF